MHGFLSQKIIYTNFEYEIIHSLADSKYHETKFLQLKNEKLNIHTSNGKKKKSRNKRACTLFNITCSCVP